ncbi:FIST signal transduction protein [Geothrix sp. PMB-07]|uniref:FIST signal transduction protein n=1 Tax=Geothrix sp. PMB-07 TaxID=3068640 RepID=UPI0027404F84|nr:FIST N-terminal domain-containing protein [Geothrix sp. PMB-07]WLT31833.1 FIST N-terminal domain-containing protein [Geothrix sp. PMB-07]
MELATLLQPIDRPWEADALPRWDGPDTLVLAFGSPELMDAPGPLRHLQATYPSSCLLGCSTAGEIHGTLVHDHQLSVAVARFANTRLRFADTAVSGPEDSEAAGAALADQLRGPGLRAVLVLSDGLRVNGSELARSLSQHLGPGVAVTGGLAGDGARFQRTWVLTAEGPQSGHFCAVGFYGNALRHCHGSKGGWDTFGPARQVTRAKGNVLFELDGKPALPLYKSYLGERASGLPATALLFPLSLQDPEGRNEDIVRTILSVDEEAQSLTFAGDIPEGHLVHFMRANFDRLVDGAGAAAQGLGDPRLSPTLAVAVSCVGRRLVLGERVDEEVEATLEALPLGTLQLGFYSYGELCPQATGACGLHNQTMTLTVFQEA